MNGNDQPLYKLSHQKWILMSQECPYSVNREIVNPLMDRIDWIQSYRTNSDIFSPYGKIEKVKNNEKWIHNYKFKNKIKNIAWIVSHCSTPSKREVYVKQLQKYIDIDIYGECGSLKCDRNNTCLQMLEKNYKFFLSFENSICRDYVTEKLFKFLQIDIIPVVMGGADYQNFMPNNSYIDVENFTSPENLAKFLKRIGSDEEIYDSYFVWKKTYRSVIDLNHDVIEMGFCDLCKKLNTDSHSIIRGSGYIMKFWFEDAKCRQFVK